MNISGQSIVILGGTSGIGSAVAKAAIGEGAEVIVASSSQSRVDAAIAQLGAQAKGYVVDTSDPLALGTFFDAVGAFDHLVYTAGEPLNLQPLDDDIQAMRKFFELRYWGALAAAKYGRRKVRNGGSIVFTSGTAGLRPLGPGWAIASSICSAVEGMTRALALELKPLRVNAVAPGVVKTALWSDMTSADRESLYSGEAARLPVGRAGEAEEVAAGYLYLMRQTYVTGQTLYVDGGGLLV